MFSIALPLPLLLLLLLARDAAGAKGSSGFERFPVFLTATARHNLLPIPVKTIDGSALPNGRKGDSWVFRAPAPNSHSTDIELVPFETIPEETDIPVDMFQRIRWWFAEPDGQASIETPRTIVFQEARKYTDYGQTEQPTLEQNNRLRPKFQIYEPDFVIKNEEGEIVGPGFARAVRIDNEAEREEPPDGTPIEFIFPRLDAETLPEMWVNAKIPGKHEPKYNGYRLTVWQKNGDRGPQGKRIGGSNVNMLNFYACYKPQQEKYFLATAPKKSDPNTWPADWQSNCLSLDNFVFYRGFRDPSWTRHMWEASKKMRKKPGVPKTIFDRYSKALGFLRRRWTTYKELRDTMNSWYKKEKKAGKEFSREELRDKYVGLLNALGYEDEAVEYPNRAPENLGEPEEEEEELKESDDKVHPAAKLEEERPENRQNLESIERNSDIGNTGISLPEPEDEPAIQDMVFDKQKMEEEEREHEAGLNAPKLPRRQRTRKIKQVSPEVPAKDPSGKPNSRLFAINGQGSTEDSDVEVTKKKIRATDDNMVIKEEHSEGIRKHLPTDLEARMNAVRSRAPDQLLIHPEHPGTMGGYGIQDHSAWRPSHHGRDDIRIPEAILFRPDVEPRALLHQMYLDTAAKLASVTQLQREITELLRERQAVRTYIEELNRADAALSLQGNINQNSPDGQQ